MSVKGRVRPAPPTRTSTGRETLVVARKSYAPSKADSYIALFEAADITDETLKDAILGCSWLSVASPTIIPILCEIVSSAAVDDGLTLRLLENRSLGVDEAYRLLPSMIEAQEKFDRDIGYEFAAERSVTLKNRTCGECGEQQWYIDTKRPISADEIERVFYQCATCKPRT